MCIADRRSVHGKSSSVGMSHECVRVSKVVGTCAHAHLVVREMSTARQSHLVVKEAWHRKAKLGLLCACSACRAAVGIEGLISLCSSNCNVSVWMCFQGIEGCGLCTSETWGELLQSLISRFMSTAVGTGNRERERERDQSLPPCVSSPRVARHV